MNISQDYLIAIKIHGMIDFINKKDMEAHISVGAHTGFISGIEFSPNDQTVIS